MQPNTPVAVQDIAFLEFSGTAPERLLEVFRRLGFTEAGQRHAGVVSLHAQGEILFINNPSAGGHAEIFRGVHGRGVSALGLQVADAAAAFRQAVRLGAQPATLTDHPLPAIKGVGASLIYFCDADGRIELLKKFGLSAAPAVTSENALLRIDHLTHNLAPGGVARMSAFYEKLFGFRRVRSFHIEGKKTGLYSQVVASPCGRVVIPLNESKDDRSQIAEFLRDYNGEGVQHIALLSHDIHTTVDRLLVAGVDFQDTPETYYDRIPQRLPDCAENIDALRRRRILVDGGAEQGGGTLLQIFTRNSIGPIFFEFIQRKGNEGFGEGNFQALFESIELEQELRGALA